MIDLKPIKKYLKKNIQSVDECVELGLVYFHGHRFLSFIENENFLNQLDTNKDITAVLWDHNLPLPSEKKHYLIIHTRNSKLAFYTLLNNQNSDLAFNTNFVDDSAKIDQTARLLGHGIKIHKNVIIEPFVTIFQGSIIYENTIIRSGARIGAEDLEIKVDEKGNYLMVKHGGGVIIGDNVEIGYNTVVDRAVFRFDKTIIGAQSKIGSLSLVGHGSKIGIKNKVMPGTIIGGSTKINDNNWIGANTVISNQVSVGSNVHITMGSVLFEDLDDNYSYISNRKLKERKMFK